MLQSYMSRICDLIEGFRRMKVQRISISRSKKTKSTTDFLYPNLQNRKFDSSILGSLRLRISNRTFRTIEKYDGIENFLVKTKKKNLTFLGKVLKRKCIKALSPFKSEESFEKEKIT